MDHMRHQCLIYEGAPSVHLAALAANIRNKLYEHYRCMYLNSPPMVAGIRSYLAACGIDAADWTAKGSLVLSSERAHLVNGKFDTDHMMGMLDAAVKQALSDGYKGLFATGDMTWEFGPAKDFSQLLEYERKLENYFLKQPALSGVCQYHIDSLPHECVDWAKITHRSLFVNETLAHINPDFVPAE